MNTKKKDQKVRDDYSARWQYLLIKDSRSENGVPLTDDIRKKYRSKGAKFMSDLKNFTFTPGEQVYVNELSGRTWSGPRKGKVVGDYPFIVQINHGASWRDVSYSKKDILIGKVIIERCSNM